jgi:anion-transporting  ArsA/GET3 family ATPase
MGKGGVGKSTVAAALGVAAARSGRRTIVAEVARRDDVSRALHGESAGFEEVALAPNLWAISIDPQSAMEEYLVDQLPVRALAEALAGSRAFGYLAAATPGMRELLTVGKVWELAQDRRRTDGGEPYDLVVVDAPATGHGLALLAAPRTFARAARVGPIARQGMKIDATLSDATGTGVLVVATAEELAVTEALGLARGLRRQTGLDPDRVVVNGLEPRRFDARDAQRLAEALPAIDDAGARTAVETALAQHRRTRAQARQVERLRRGTGRAPARLPRLPVPRVGLAEVESLAAQLEAAL